MIPLIFITFTVALLLFGICYVAILVKIFESSRNWGLISLLFPPALVYYVYRHNEDYDKNIMYSMWSGLFLFISGLPIALFLFVVNIQANGHAMDRTHDKLMRNHFHPIYEALHLHKDEHGTFPSTEEGLTILPMEYFPENEAAWETRLETEFGPIIYTLDSPEQYTLLVPTAESIGLWGDIDYTYNPNENHSPKNKRRF